MRHTIFTPVYNRSAKLLELYAHMKELRYPRDSFEWLIVDDGSQDDLDKVLALISNENVLNMRVIRHEKNRGIQAAQNTAIRNAKGDFVTRIDSDDYLLPDALAIKDKYWDAIPDHQKSHFIGVVGIVLHASADHHPTKNRSSLFGQEITDTTGIEAQKRYHATGDRNFCMRTEIMRQYLLPEYEDTHWVPEGAMWRMIDKKYLTRFIDVPVSVAASNEADSVTNRQDHTMSLKFALSCAYGHLLMLNQCPETLSPIEKRKRIIFFVSFAKAANKENGSFCKIVHLLSHRYHRFLAYLYFPIICLSAKKVKKKIRS